LQIKLNIVYKLIGYLVIVSLLPLLIFTFISYEVVRDTILELTSQDSVQLVNNQRDYLQQQVIQQIDNLAGRIVGNEAISSILFKAVNQTSEERSTYDELAAQEEIRTSLTLFSNLKGIVSIDIFTPNGHRVYVGDTLSVAPVDDKVRDAMLQAALADSNPVHWLGVVNNLNTESPSVKVLSAIKIFRRFVAEKQATVVTGMVIINYSTDVLYDHYSHIKLGLHSNLFILDALGRMIYSLDQSQIGQQASDTLLQGLKSANGSGLVTFNGVESLVSKAKLEQGSWEVVGVIPKETLLAPMHRLTQVLLILIVLSFVVIFFASQFFRRTMVLPVQAI